MGWFVITVSKIAAILTALFGAAYRMSWGKGVSPKKGVGFKKVGRENVSRVSNPEKISEE